MYALLLNLALLFSLFQSIPAQAPGIPYTFEPSDCSFLDLSLGPLINPAPESQGYDCGYVVVPERHDRPEGPTIKLPVAILRATGPNVQPDPLFVAQGGPGGSAFEIFPFMVPGTDIAAQRDIIIFNQRGTRHAQPELTCPEMLDNVAELAALPGEESDALWLELFDDCMRRLEADGADLSAYNSLENARDVPAIADALGYDSYNFYGVSYGTLLGLHLMRDNPPGLRSVILDSVVPTDLNFNLEAVRSENRIYDELFAACEADPECRQGYPDLEARFFALVAELDQEPITLRTEDPKTGQRVETYLDGAGLMGIIFTALYYPDNYALFPRMVADLERGEYLFIEQLLALITFDREMAEGMYFTVVCTEDGDFTVEDADLSGLRPQIAENASGALQSILDACVLTGVEALPAGVDDPVVSDIPTLLLSGQFDPITPPAFAAQAAAGLSNGYNVVDPLSSHGVAFREPCVNDIVSQFLDRPESEPDTTCLADPERRAPLIAPGAVVLPLLVSLAQLETSFFTQLAVTTLLLSGLLSAFLVWPLAWLVRRLLKKPLTLTTNVRRRRLLGRLLVLFFGLVALVFVTGLTAVVIYTLFATPVYLNLFALPWLARPFLWLGYLLLLVALAIVALAVIAWLRNRDQPLWEKLYYSFLALCAAGYVIALGFQGFL